MPEGPEVKTITDQLIFYLTGRVLEKFKILGGRYSKKFPKGFEEFEEDLPLKIKKVYCKGKLIVMKMKKGWYILCSLGMSGIFTIEKEKHSHLCLKLEAEEAEDDSLISKLYFTDQRHFGTFSFLKKKEALKRINKIALGFLKPLDDSEEDVLPREVFIEKIQNKIGKHLAVVLMSQTEVCSGIGNYLLSEIFYSARINPFCYCDELEEEKIGELYDVIVEIMNDSYASGGLSIYNYKTAEGEKGKFIDKLKVYSKKEDPSGNEVYVKLGPHRRNIHFVPALQTE